MAVKQKVFPPRGPFFAAIRALRLALELSQEQAAHRVGVTLGAWRSWEAGVNSPRRSQLEKIAALPDDPKVRIIFWLDIYLGGMKLAVMPSRTAPGQRQDAEVVKCAQTVLESVRRLVLSAAASRAAWQELKSLAGRLRRAAGRFAPANSKS